MTKARRTEILSGTLDLLVLQTLASMGTMHGWGIARRIEQVSQDAFSLNQGTLYPALLRLEQRGFIRSEWGLSENRRQARFYSLTRAGQQQLEREARDWRHMVSILDRFLEDSE